MEYPFASADVEPELASAAGSVSGASTRRLIHAIVSTDASMPMNNGHLVSHEPGGSSEKPLLLTGVHNGRVEVRPAELGLVFAPSWSQ